MPYDQIANEHGSTPCQTLAVDSKQEQLKQNISSAQIEHCTMRYLVEIAMDIAASYHGELRVYASSPEDAAAKVTALIDDGLDDYTGMKDLDSNYATTFGILRDRFGGIPYVMTDYIEPDDYQEVDPAVLLEAEIERLYAVVPNNVGKLAKIKRLLIELNNPD